MPMSHLPAAGLSQDALLPEHAGVLLGISFIPVLVFVASFCAQLLQSHIFVQDGTVVCCATPMSHLVACPAMILATD